MAKRANPERIHEAKRAATIERIVSSGIGGGDAESWVAAWEREAQALGLLRTDWNYWEAGVTWITMKRAQDRRPPR